MSAFDERLPPGRELVVGSHRLKVQRYLSEGGFAQVYVVELPNRESDNNLAVLKRILVPDKASLGYVRIEVDVMKRLAGKPYVVSYYDSHASRLENGRYEALLLMEFCSGGGLIDFMNSRLQERLTEPEILKIFSDVCEGVASMHKLNPPLIHRDLKVENVLIANDSERSYKICDFGSATGYIPVPTSAAGFHSLDDDIQRHTTLQYRSPEMLDVYRQQPINDKSDIWALGVLLYKLCYYTTPFEQKGAMAVLTASFSFPPYPYYSRRLRNAICVLLQEDPNKRPNIIQVIREVYALRGMAVPSTSNAYSRSTEKKKAERAVPGPESKSSERVNRISSDQVPVRRQTPIEGESDLDLPYSFARSYERMTPRSGGQTPAISSSRQSSTELAAQSSSSRTGRYIPTGLDGKVNSSQQESYDDARADRNFIGPKDEDTRPVLPRRPSSRASTRSVIRPRDGKRNLPARPQSMFVESNVDFLKTLADSTGQQQHPESAPAIDKSITPTPTEARSSIEFLRGLQTDEAENRRKSSDRRRTSIEQFRGSKSQNGGSHSKKKLSSKLDSIINMFERSGKQNSSRKSSKEESRKSRSSSKDFVPSRSSSFLSVNNTAETMRSAAVKPIDKRINNSRVSMDQSRDVPLAGNRAVQEVRRSLEYTRSRPFVSTTDLSISQSKTLPNTNSIAKRMSLSMPSSARLSSSEAKSSSSREDKDRLSHKRKPMPPPKPKTLKSIIPEKLKNQSDTKSPERVEIKALDKDIVKDNLEQVGETNNNNNGQSNDWKMKFSERFPDLDTFERRY